MGKKALVLGAAGNVGRPLVTHLRAMDYDVLEVDIKPGWRDNYLVADINNAVDLLPAFDWNPDVVYLMSAMVSRVTCEQAGGLAIETNLAGLNAVLQLCKRANAMTVFFSTSEVYGPTVEVMDETLSNPEPNNRYGLSKLLGEQLVRYEARYHGLRACILRPFMIYDENEHFGDHRSAIIRFATNLALGKPIEVHSGSARGWLHVSDAVRAIEAASRHEDSRIFNIGNADVRTILELAHMIRQILGVSESLLVEREMPQQMTQIKSPSLQRMYEELGVEPAVSLEEGAERVCRRVKERLSLLAEAGVLGAGVV